MDDWELPHLRKPHMKPVIIVEHKFSLLALQDIQVTFEFFDQYKSETTMAKCWPTTFWGYIGNWLVVFTILKNISQESIGIYHILLVALITYSYWLLVYLPLWKIWVHQLGLWNSQLNGTIIQMFQTTNQYIARVPENWHAYPQFSWTLPTFASSLGLSMAFSNTKTYELFARCALELSWKHGRMMIIHFWLGVTPLQAISLVLDLLRPGTKQ